MKKKLNSEIKVKVDELEPYRQRLLETGAEFKGTDHQKDTYFKVARGRLKLREGNIERALIYYDRDDKSFPKKSEIILVKPVSPELKAMLFRALDVLAVVEKHREIYFIDNAKFHLDHVPNLGFFVEIEVMGDPKADFDQLTAQLQQHVEFLQLPLDAQVHHSYSDLVLAESNDTLRD